MTAPLLAGIDVGGTKTHVRVVAGSTVLHDQVVPSTGWSATPVDEAADWLAALLPRPVSFVAVGAQGCEERSSCALLRTALEDRLGIPALVVNDAELLVPAAGLTDGIALVAGTGAIAVHSGDRMLRAGGWGWVLGDDGSASALVRQAARAVLARTDRGDPPDALGHALLRSVGVPTVAALAHTLSWGDGPEHWGRHAPAVVAAAGSSSDARQVLDEGARALVTLVETLVRRGVTTRDVVVAGGLITNVPTYWAKFRALLSERLAEVRPTLLPHPPVAGAIALARRSGTAPVPADQRSAGTDASGQR
ncbi:N-acetylglucosamine kinase [Nonomuraea sp. NPDC050556]|uniref:N-acetylglucosamine kinase n=1 Tax=Nonomuraea sp. NPDC050556 TaxID=3364369 RepID=UPI0037A04F11